MLADERARAASALKKASSVRLGEKKRRRLATELSPATRCSFMGWRDGGHIFDRFRLNCDLVKVDRVSMVHDKKISPEMDILPPRL